MIRRAEIRGEIHGDSDSIFIQPIRDSPYNDQAWIANVQKAVDRVIPELPDGELQLKIGLTGFKKDRSSYYVKMFPDWGAVEVQSQYGTLNATDIRKDYLRRAPIIPSKHLCPSATSSILEEFILADKFKWLVSEAEFYDAYKARWGITPYPVFINCVDAVVVQAGHILLVERRDRPGRGLLALPGGHVNVDETFEDAAIRELKEETRISDGRGEIPPARLASFIKGTKTRLFDDPHRSERGRVVTEAFLFDLPRQSSLFQVRGDDDAAHARWHELGTLSSTDLFEDHAAIIEEMTGTIID